MDRIIAPLKLGDSSPQVANLQDALLAILEHKLIRPLDAPNRPTVEELQQLTERLKQEREQSLFGKAQQQLISFFQIQEGLGDQRGAVKEKTAAKLNEMLASINAFDSPVLSRLVVRGTVSYPDHSRAIDLSFIVFDDDVRGEDLLASGMMKYRSAGTAKAALITFLSLALVGCGGTAQLLQGDTGQPVTVKASDPTPPPGITLETHGRPGGEVALKLGEAPLTTTVGRGESFFLRAIAEDPDGIKQVAIWGTTEKSCTDPTADSAQYEHPGLVAGPLVKDLSGAAPGGTASTGRYVSYVVKPDLRCPAPLRFSFQKFVFWGEATNFSNLRTKGPKLTVTVK